MRATYKVDFITDGDLFMGVYLHPGWVGEQERGIKELQSLFGIKEDESVMGIERYKASAVPPTLFSYFTASYGALTVGYIPVGNVLSRQTLPEDLQGNNHETLAAWDRYSFGIRTKDKQNRKHLKELEEAIKKCNVGIWIGGGSSNGKVNPFARYGVMISIYDKIPFHEARKIKTFHEEGNK